MDLVQRNGLLESESKLRPSSASYQQQIRGNQPYHDSSFIYTTEIVTAPLIGH